MKVMIIDDQVLFREGLASLLNGQPDFEVIGEADNVDSATCLLTAQSPDLVLYDPCNRNGDQIHSIQSIVSHFPSASVVILTNEESDELLFNAFRVGADGYLLKNTPIALLLDALRNTRHGEAALNGKLTTRILGEFKRIINQSNLTTEGLDKLTNREIDILRELGKGASNYEIAQNLTISINTVKVHVHNILDKLELMNRMEAGQLSRRLGLPGVSDRTVEPNGRNGGS
jgi:DNA-binding NarL/FixJ family response regulator